MVFEDGHELGPAVDLDSPDLEGRAREQLVEQVPCGVGGGRGRNVADRPFGDRIVSGEVFDRPVGLDVDEEGVDLDEFAGRPRFSALGQTLGVTLAGVEAEAPAAGPAPQDRHGNDRAASHQPAQDPPDLGDADGLSFVLEERRDLALAPHRVVSADGLDRRPEPAATWAAGRGWAGAIAARPPSPTCRASHGARPRLAPPARRSARWPSRGASASPRRVFSPLRYSRSSLRED